jgi:hypothetical protein
MYLQESINNVQKAHSIYNNLILTNNSIRVIKTNIMA